MKIGILQTGHAPDALLPQTGDYDALFERLLGGYGFTFETFNVVDMEFPDSPADCDGWLITGSKHGAYEDHAFIPPLEDFIRTAYADNRPLVGICFGHQIIAQALGGTVKKFAGGWSVGHRRYDWMGRDVALNAWHQDQVVERPKDATVVASNDFCANAALVYGDRAFSIQAHPEFGAEFIEGLIAHRSDGIVPPALIGEARRNLLQPVDQDLIAGQIAGFFKTRSIA